PVDSVTDYGWGDTIRTSGSRSYAGQETVTIGGTPFDAVKIAVQYTASRSGYSGYDGKETGSYWFIPKIGFFGKGSVTGEWATKGYYSDNTESFNDQFELTMYGSNMAATSPKAGAAMSANALRHILSPKSLMQQHAK